MTASEPGLPPSPVDTSPMLMLWDGAMEVGPLTLPAFRRGIGLGSITGITHVRVLPSYEWIEMKDFSGSGHTEEGADTCFQKEAVPQAEAESEVDYFYRPLSPYRWLGAWAACWGIVSVAGLVLPESFVFLALFSVSGALMTAVFSMVLNRRVYDLWIPLFCVGLILNSVFRDEPQEFTKQASVIEKVQPVEKKSSEPRLLNLDSQSSLADLPKLEEPKIPSDWK